MAKIFLGLGEIQTTFQMRNIFSTWHEASRASWMPAAGNIRRFLQDAVVPPTKPINYLDKGFLSLEEFQTIFQKRNISGI
jgi:hypothetical protein